MGRSFDSLRARVKPEYSRLYNQKLWRKRRLEFLALNPWCAHCFDRGHLVLANVVNHKKPHKGNLQLFWDQKNWQSLCTDCHNITTLTGDKPRGFGVDGRPLDPSHPWAKKDG